MVPIIKSLSGFLPAVFVISIMLFSPILSSPASAQDIAFSYAPETESLAPDQFRIDLFEAERHDRTIRVRENEIVFGNGAGMLAGYDQISISPDRAFVGALFLRGDNVSVEIYRSDGSLVRRFSELASYDPDDPSIRLYMLNGGSFFYCDNIAGFSYFDERGEQVYRASNSSGSPDGETISELATTPFGTSAFAYNPKIYEGDQVHSRIQRIGFDGETRPVARFDAAGIEDVTLHPEGRLIIAHLIDEATGNHRAKVISFRGELLAEVDYEDNEILEMALSECGRYVTARASGRVLVHEVTTGERLGSASFTEQVLVASWMPDNRLAVLTGTRYGDRELNDLRAHIIDVRQRRVAREETSLTTYEVPHAPLQFSFHEQGTYKLTGTNRPIVIRHSL